MANVTIRLLHRDQARATALVDVVADKLELRPAAWIGDTARFYVPDIADSTAACEYIEQQLEAQDANWARYLRVEPTVFTRF